MRRTVSYACLFAASLLFVAGCSESTSDDGGSGESGDIIKPEFNNSDGKDDSQRGINDRGVIEYGEARTGTFERDAQFDAYTFQASAGSEVTLEVTQRGTDGTLDTTLFVFGPPTKGGAIATLTELDKISWVSTRAFDKMYKYAKANGIMNGNDGANYSGGDAVRGYEPGSPAAKAILEVANTSSKKVLDDDVSLDRRAAQNIIDTRKKKEGEQEDALAFDNDSGFAQLSLLEKLQIQRDGEHTVLVGTPRGLDRGAYRLKLECNAASCEGPEKLVCTDSSSSKAKSVLFATNDNAPWSTILPTGYTYEDMTSAPAPVSLYDAKSGDVSGFFGEVDVGSSVQSPVKLVENQRKVLKNVGSLVQDSIGGEFKTYGSAKAAMGRFRVSLSNAASLKKLRETLLLDSTQLAASTVNLPSTSGNATTEFHVYVSAVLQPNANGAPTGVISTAITPLHAYETTRYHLDNLTSGYNVLFAKSAPSDRCTQWSKEWTSSKADFYFVLDQSGSMDDDNGQLRKAAFSLFDELQKTQVDYRLAITTMDRSTKGAPIGGDWFDDRPTFEDRIDKVVNWQGAQGKEHGLTNARDGIKSMRNASSSQLGIRKDAKLITLFITDEETQEFQDGIEPNLFSSFETFFKANTTAFSIVRYSNDKGTDGEAYRSIAQATGGSAADLRAADFTQAVKNILTAASGAASDLTLSDEALGSSIRVFQDGKEIPRSQKDGFDYFPETNSIAFFGSHQPKPGAKIVVHYQKL